MPWLPDWITGYDEANALAANQADQRRAELDAAAVVAGQITAEDYQRRQTTYGVDPATDRAAIDQTFADSVKDNANSLASGINSTLSFSLGTLFKAVPWWLWLAGAFALFLYLGGGEVIRGRVARLG